MSEPTELEAAAGGDMNAVIDAAQAAVAPVSVEGVEGLLVGFGPHDDTWVDLETFLPVPRRTRGTATVSDPESFASYFGRFDADVGTTVWADHGRDTITAVLNDDDPEGPKWRDHRVKLVLEFTDEWRHWTDGDRRLAGQEQFAEHIEDGAPEIRKPDAATMLEIAQSFHANRDVRFKSGTRVSSGEVQLTYEESIDAKAGRKGEIEIPETFELGIAPYRGTEPYKVTARLRYRIRDGELSIGYRLVRPVRVLEAAFKDVVEAVADRVDRQVHFGTPPQPAG